MASIPGDGIGPETVAATIVVLEAAASRFGFAYEWTEALAGGAAIDAYGVPLRDEDLALCRGRRRCTPGRCGRAQVGCAHGEGPP